MGLCPLEVLALVAFSDSAIHAFVTRGNLLRSSVRRLVMYIERDSRKTSPDKEQQSGSEYLSRCLGLLIRHVVQELPRVLGEWELRPQAPGCLPRGGWQASPPFQSRWPVPEGERSDTCSCMCSFKVRLGLTCFPDDRASVTAPGSEPAGGGVPVSWAANRCLWKSDQSKAF